MSASSERILQCFIILTLVMMIIVGLDDYNKRTGIFKLIDKYSNQLQINANQEDITLYNPDTSTIPIITPSQNPIGKPVGYHSKKTKFVSNSITSKYFGPKKGWGLIAESDNHTDIEVGQILLVEYPLVILSNGDKISSLSKKIATQKNDDGEFNRIWTKEMFTNKKLSKRYSSMDSSDPNSAPDLATFYSNKFGVLYHQESTAIYGVLSKINFGLPQNVAMIFGDDADQNVVILLATKKIKEGEELVSDYYFDWKDIDSINDANTLKMRQSFGADFGFQLNEKWQKVTRDLNSKQIKQRRKDKIFQRIYPNGIVGRKSGKDMEVMKGCNHLTDKECKLKGEIKDFVDSKIFKVIKGEEKPPKWSGTEFQKAMMVG